MQRFPLSVSLAHLQMYAPVLFAIGMMAGAAGYFAIGFEPVHWVIYAFIAGLILIWRLLALSRVPAGISVAVMIVIGAAAGVAAGCFASSRVDTVTIEREMPPVWLEGWIEKALPAERGTRLELRVHAVDGLASEETPTHVRLTHVLDLNTEPGRFVRCWAVLRPPPAPVLIDDYAFDQQAWYQGLGAVGYVQGRCRGAVLGMPHSFNERVLNWISVSRRQLARYVSDHAGARAGGFAAALASGDRSFMAVEDQDALRGAGLAHLLAISGLHMGIVGGLVFLIVWRALACIEFIALRVNVKKPAAIAALVACLTYLILSGASVSTQRAFIMAAVLFGAVLIDRSALSLRSLAIAMILILFLFPWSVVTPGFQMSFAATGALIATYERWQRRLRASAYVRRRPILFWFQGLVVTSTVSGFATMPFALYHFGRVAGLGLAANLIAMPIVSVLSAPAATAALVLAPVGLDHWALRLFGWSLELILAIAHYFSRILPDEQMSLSQMPSLSAAIFSLGIVVFCLVRNARTAWMCAAALSGLSIAVWWGSFHPQVHWAPSGDVYVERGHGDVVRAQPFKGDGLPPLRFADQSVRMVCEAQADCTINTTAGRVAIDVSARTVSLEPLSKTGLKSSQVTVSWDDVQRENGVSYIFRRGAIRKIEKPRCGVRPWRPCRSRHSNEAALTHTSE